MSPALSTKAAIHVFAALSLLALWGALTSGATVLYLLAALAGYGALCSAFTYTIRKVQR